MKYALWLSRFVSNLIHIQLSPFHLINDETILCLARTYEPLFVLFTYTYPDADTYLPFACTLIISYFQKLISIYGINRVVSVLTCPEHGDRVYQWTVHPEKATSAAAPHPRGFAPWLCTCGGSAYTERNIIPPHFALCYALTSVISSHDSTQQTVYLDIASVFVSGHDTSAKSVGKVRHLNDWVCGEAAVAGTIPSWFLYTIDWDVCCAFDVIDRTGVQNRFLRELQDVLVWMERNEKLLLCARQTMDATHLFHHLPNIDVSMPGDWPQKVIVSRDLFIQKTEHSVPSKIARSNDKTKCAILDKIAEIRKMKGQKTIS